MTVHQIVINKLFGAYNYTIDFNDLGQIAIITGPNGYGKTTILRILYCISDGNLSYFLNLVFDRINIRFSDGSSLNISRKVGENDENDSEENRAVTFELINTLNIGNSIFEISDNDVKLQKKIRQKNIAIEGATLYYNDDKDMKDPDDVELTKMIAKEKGCEQFIMQLSDIKCTFVTDNRIYSFSAENNKKKESVDAVADAIKRIINEEIDRYLITSQKVNEEMVSNLMDGLEIPFDMAGYQSMTDKLEPKISMMRRFNISDDIRIRPFDEKMSKILTVDILGIGKKIEPCERTLNKLELFRELLEGKELTNKDIIFNRRIGIAARAKSSGEIIELNELSSGEKNEIVMIYNMIFATEDKSMLLIDEPENSLHVAWQTMFLDDIKKVADIKDIKVIIATHSPAIIGERWNMTYDLYERNKKI